MGEHAGHNHLLLVGLGVETPDKLGAYLRDAVGGSRVIGAAFMDGQLLTRNPSENLGGGAHMYHRIYACVPSEDLQQALGTLDIRFQGSQGSGKTDQGIALSGQMEDIVGTAVGYRSFERKGVPQITIEEEQSILSVHAIQQMLHVFQRAAPAADAVDVPVGTLQQVIRQMRSDHPCDTRDQGARTQGLVSLFQNGQTAGTSNTIAMRTMKVSGSPRRM